MVLPFFTSNERHHADHVQGTCTYPRDSASIPQKLSAMGFLVRGQAVVIILLDLPTGEMQVLRIWRSFSGFAPLQML